MTVYFLSVTVHPVTVDFWSTGETITQTFTVEQILELVPTIKISTTEEDGPTEVRYGTLEVRCNAVRPSGTDSSYKNHMIITTLHKCYTFWCKVVIIIRLRNNMCPLRPLRL